ncbi:hypothetical protein SteCoe_12184 [Stentor coeruleus]|uniref:U-box domain-containing protein n=1 Tax=Stentor coeruleus TaxID=5963 RepID=A0A1R2CBF4_9CILI|nr:hypothetical protein SteCoe_12184 [Stentor coeruleus]
MSMEEPYHLAILTNYLVRPCPGSCENPQLCLFYHSLGERRRCPFNGNELAYSDHMCQNVSKGISCEDSCRYTHNFQEIVYHPNRYKVSWCEQASCKGYYLCYQAHRSNEKLRIATHFTVSPQYTPTNFSTHLDLLTFKVNLCNISEPHNPKLCVFYHSTRDRRRLGNYSYEMCAENEKDLCGNPDTCLKSHNRVEQLYHPDKYKMKFCTFYPKKIHECEYSSYCSFAHSETDIKIELVHNYQRNEDFYMYSFKTVWCPFILQHDKAMCVYAHNWQDFRRKPKDVNFTDLTQPTGMCCAYNSVPCPSWKSSNFILSYEEGGCKNMTSCKKCHGWKEIEYHPNTYKMKPCSQGKKCTKQQDCPFYHSNKDRRTCDMSPLKEVSNRFIGITPHPQKQFLSPETFKGFQTPFVFKQSAPVFQPSSSNVDQVKQINSTTDEFVLHRGTANRFNSKATEEFTLRRNEAPKNYPSVEEFPFLGSMPSMPSTPNPKSFSRCDSTFSQGTPVRTPGGNSYLMTPQSKDLDSRVLQFLSRHKLKHLSSRFKGVKWEDLDTFHLYDDNEDEEFQEAWLEEKEDQDQLDELIMTDIALFTGQKTGQTPDLKKFAGQDEVEDFIVTFPKSSFIPTHLKCPITKKLMRDPAVFSLDGRTYERVAIIKYIQTSYQTLEAQQLVRNLHSDKFIREELLSRFS